ncbi:MAG TPA: DUF1843 domain-containing protein [Beijerinckiaceae bacterium]|jgi:uncharacterized protein YpuA (DUF1002 family)
MAILLYGPAITEAIAKGDVAEMRRLKDLAEKHVKEHGNVAAVLEHLKVEIAKAKAAGKR